jgi:hypothetical protein
MSTVVAGNALSSLLSNNLFIIAAIGGIAYVIFFTELGDVIKCVFNPATCAGDAADKLLQKFKDLEKELEEKAKQGIKDITDKAGELVDKAKEKTAEIIKDTKEGIHKAEVITAGSVAAVLTPTPDARKQGNPFVVGLLDITGVARTPSGLGQLIKNPGESPVAGSLLPVNQFEKIVNFFKSKF